MIEIGQRKDCPSLMTEIHMHVDARYLTVRETHFEFIEFGVERHLARVKCLPWERVHRVAAGLTRGLTASSEGEEA
jgi:hypothetical protein